jgi:chromosome segregation ATPase
MQTAIDARIKNLIDGYEGRVKDLTEEVHALRDEVRNLRVALGTARVDRREMRADIQTLTEGSNR